MRAFVRGPVHPERQECQDHHPRHPRHCMSRVPILSHCRHFARLDPLRFRRNRGLAIYCDLYLPVRVNTVSGVCQEITYQLFCPLQLVQMSSLQSESSRQNGFHHQMKQSCRHQEQACGDLVRVHQ